MKQQRFLLYFVFVCCVVGSGSAYGQADMTGIHTERCYHDKELHSIRYFDGKGHCTFSKDIIGEDWLHCEATDYDSIGGVRCSLVVEVIHGRMSGYELRYTAATITQWAAPNPNPVTAFAAGRGSIAWTLEGYPHTAAELRADPSVKAQLLGKAMQQQVTTRNANGDAVRTTDYDAKGEVLAVHAFTYDAQGRCIQMRYHVGDETGSATDYFKTYDEKGNLTQELAVFRLASIVDTTSTLLKSYGPHGVDLVTKYRGSNRGTLLFAEKYLYNDAGDNIRILRQTGRERQPSTYWDCQYDAQHRPVLREEYRGVYGNYGLYEVRRWEYE